MAVGKLLIWKQKGSGGATVRTAKVGGSAGESESADAKYLTDPPQLG